MRIQNSRWKGKQARKERTRKGRKERGKGRDGYCTNTQTHHTQVYIGIVRLRHVYFTLSLTLLLKLLRSPLSAPVWFFFLLFFFPGRLPPAPFHTQQTHTETQIHTPDFYIYSCEVKIRKEEITKRGKNETQSHTHTKAKRGEKKKKEKRKEESRLKKRHKQIMK